MTTVVPEFPKIYHITHFANLARIVEDGRLWSDAKRLEKQLSCEIVGMSTIKKRRLEELDVGCHPGTKVGQYVPFYFCPRSIMLYILHRANHPDVTYQGGQEPMVHLEADLHCVVSRAEKFGRRWAFSTSNAGAKSELVAFHNSLDQLGEIRWNAVNATDFRAPDITHGKQAEFLVFESFPWTRVDKIGVKDDAWRRKVETILANADHQPKVQVEPSWYF